MTYYRIDDETIWEPTGHIRVHTGIQRTWVTRIYKETKKGKLGSKEVEGPSMDLEDLTADQKALVTCIGMSQKALHTSMPIHPSLEKCKVSKRTAFKTLDV